MSDERDVSVVSVSLRRLSRAAEAIGEQKVSGEKLKKRARWYSEN
jgi:hypothetical protein